MLRWLTRDVEQFVLRPMVQPPYVLEIASSGNVYGIHLDGRVASSRPIWQANTQSLAVEQDWDTYFSFGVVRVGRQLLSRQTLNLGSSFRMFDAQSGCVTTLAEAQRDCVKPDSQRNCPYFGMINDAGSRHSIALDAFPGAFDAVLLPIDPNPLARRNVQTRIAFDHTIRDVILDDRQPRYYIVSAGLPRVKSVQCTRRIDMVDLECGSVASTHIGERSINGFYGSAALATTVALCELSDHDEVYHEFDLRAESTDPVLTMRLEMHSVDIFTPKLLVSDRQDTVYYRSLHSKELFNVDRRATTCYPIASVPNPDNLNAPTKLTFHH